MKELNNSKNPIIKIDPTIIKIILIAIVLVASVIIIGLMFGDNETNNAIDFSEMDYSELEDQPNIKYDNLTYLRKMAGGTLPSDFYVVIPKIVFNNLDENNQPEDYSVKVDNSSLITSVYFPYNICNFVLSVSDGRKYQIGLASNEQNMGGLLVIPLDSDDEGVILYLLNASSSEKNDSDVATIKEWAETIYDGEMTIISDLD